MEYLPDETAQLWRIIYSAGFGFFFGLVYDLFRLLLFVFTGNDKKFASIRDAVYVFVLFWSDFIFFLTVYYGRFMFYAFAGEAAGLIIFFCTVSKMLYRPLKRKIRKIRKILYYIFNKFAAGLAFFSTFIRKSLKNFSFF